MNLGPLKFSQDTLSLTKDGTSLKTTFFILQHMYICMFAESLCAPYLISQPSTKLLYTCFCHMHVWLIRRYRNAPKSCITCVNLYLSLISHARSTAWIFPNDDCGPKTFFYSSVFFWVSYITCQTQVRSQLSNSKIPSCWHWNGSFSICPK